MSRRLLQQILVVSLVTLAGVPHSAMAGEPHVWDPFTADLGDALRARDPHVVISDGDFGAPILLLHEPGAGPLIDVRRDGLPLGTGHRWCDDLWTVSLAGIKDKPGPAAVDGSAGRLDLHGVVADTAGTRVISKWFKGGDESYLRRISLRTPRAPWVLGFDFDERILHDYTSRDADLSEFPPFPRPPDDTRQWPAQAGEAKARIARTTLVHRAADGSRLEIVHSRVRKHKQALPAFDQDRHEFWIDRTHISWEGAAAGGSLKIGAVINGADLISRQRDSAVYRKIETVRQEALLNWSRRDTTWNLEMTAASLRLHDDAEGLVWAGQDGIPRDRSLQQGHLDLARSWPIVGWRARLATGIGLRRGLAPWPRLALRLVDGTGRFRFTLSRNGRAPASDELWTPWTTAAPGLTVRTLPNDGLGRERVLRGALSWAGSRAGVAYRLTSTVRRLRDGIGWDLVDDDPAFGLRGRWRNGLEVDGWTAGLHVENRRRFAGHLRLEGRVDIRGWTSRGGEADLLAVALPPEHSGAVAAWWDHVWFDGDGILELGWQSEFRGAMSDPWLPDGTVTLPAMSMHNALVMFRLTGADLGVALRNVTNSRVRLSSGAMARGRELRWRLEWTLWH